MATGPIVELFRSLARRKVFQAGLLYLGAAWAALEATSFFIQNYDLSQKLVDVTVLLLILGFPAVLVITWYHGEKGRQHLVRSELAILTTLFVLAAVGTYRISTGVEVPSATSGGGAPSTAPVADLGAGSVAILPFTNSTGADSLDWLGPGVSDILTSNLARLAGVNVVSPQRLFDLLREEGREETDRIPDQFAMEIAARSGARLLARGSVLGQPGNLTIDAQLIDLSDGTLVGVGRARGDDLFALADTVALALAEHVAEEGWSTEVASAEMGGERSPLALSGDLTKYQAYTAELRARWKELDSEDVDGRLELVELYRLMPGREKEQWALLEEVVQVRPDAAQAIEALTELAIVAGDEAGADSFMVMHRELSGETARGKLARGRLQESAGHLEQARELYRQAVSGREAAPALDLLARAYFGEDRPENAREELQRYASSADPTASSRSRLLIGDSFVWEGQFEEALAAYAGVLLSAGRTPPKIVDDALAGVADVEVLLESPRPSLFNRTIWRLLEVGRGKKALDLIDASGFVHLKDARRVPPARYLALLYARGRALELMEREKEALKAYERVLTHWGGSLDEVPMLRDLPERTERLRASLAG